MKKSTLLVLLSGILILASCGSDNSKTNNNSDAWQKRGQNTSSNWNIKWDKVSKEECMNGCYIMWKSNPGNKDKGESEMNKNCEDLCNASQWIENNDLSSCEKASDPMLKNPCYWEVAKNKWDVNICNKISEKLLKDACITWVAEKLKDESLCNKISESFMKTSCLDSVKDE